MRLRIKQALRGKLAVDFNQRIAHLPQQADAHGLIVDIGFAATVTSNSAAQD